MSGAPIQEMLGDIEEQGDAKLDADSVNIAE
jgi:hypothetical protein